MSSTCLYFVLIVCFTSYVVTITKANQDDAVEFKMAKVNAIWQKATKVLTGKKLDDLYADLLIQDKKEKDFKKLKAEGKDTNGVFEADVKKEYVGILRKYDLSAYFSSEMLSAEKLDVNNANYSYQLMDDRLKKMWKTAIKEGFTDNEMQILREELKHHQLKLDEYTALQSEYDSLEAQVDNSVENLDSQEQIMKELASKKESLKDKHKEVKSHFKKLEAKVTDRVASKFEDPRVQRLWVVAQKTILDEKELESIRTELAQFEHRIKKAQYIQEELHKSEIKLQTGEETNATKLEELKNRAKNYHKKVEKYHDDLKSRIHRRFDEL